MEVVIIESIIGFLAGFSSMISLFPQIHKTYTTKSTKDLSTLMLLNFVFSSLMWVFYGLMIDSVAVWLTNIIMLICAIFLIYFKYKYEYTKFIAK